MAPSQRVVVVSLYVALAVGIRVVLVLHGAGQALVWQPEVTTPANTPLKIREGLRLLQLGNSPYDGSSCHVPPLWLAVAAPVASHPVLHVLPNIICDLVAAAALVTAASALYGRHGARKPYARDEPWLDATQLALAYLFNPFTIFSCVAGTLTSAENASVLLAVAGGCLRNGPLAGAALAVGAYLGLHPLLLLVPLLLLLWRGAEDPLLSLPQGPAASQLCSSGECGAAGDAGQQAGGAAGEACTTAATALDSRLNTEQAVQGRASRAAPRARKAAQAEQQAQPQQQQQQQLADSKADANGGTAAQTPSSSAAVAGSCSLVPCVWFVAVFLASTVALWVLSDVLLQQYAASQCLRPLLSTGLSAASPTTLLGVLGRCWAGRVYGLTLFLQDLTPNIGLWWYFFTEVFTEFQPFFLFVFHSFAVVLVMPVALRFSNRPLFVTWVQLFVSCMFKPYACVGDMVGWMCLLPLLQQQLQGLKLRMFLINSFVLLLVLGPAMWHQWIVVDSANANFFYSITLLLGVWYTVFLMQLLRLTVLCDRWVQGKGPPPQLVTADGRVVGREGLVAYAAALQAQAADHAQQTVGSGGTL